MQARRVAAQSRVIEVSDASVRRGDRWVLAHLDLEVARGSALWVTGNNGAGKSTLLRLMAGMFAPQRGSVRLFGVAGPPWPPNLRRQLGLMGHAHGLYEAFGGPENLRWAAELAGLRGAIGRAAAAARLEEVGLTAAGDLPVGRYSAGMQRRLALARLLLWQPQLMLVDEPFVQLDAAGEQVVQRALSAHLRGGGTLVFTSHDAAAARRLAAARLHLEGGFASPWQLDAPPSAVDR